MREKLNYYYNINAIGIIKVSQKVYKIKTKDTFYALKLVRNKLTLEHYPYVNSLHLDCFIPIIVNCDGNFLTSYQDQYFYVMPWIVTDDFIVKELKLRQYFYLLAMIHNRSYYSLKVNIGYFKSMIEQLNEMIVARLEYYTNKLQQFEFNYFKSPAEWEFALNFPLFIKQLEQSRNFLSLFENISESLTSVRLSLVYMNFNVKHISLQANMLLSIDKIRIDLPIYDLYDLFLHQDTMVYENGLLVESYLHKFMLYDYERVLLACLLTCIPLLEFSKDEVDNVIRITKLLNYIDSSQQFITKLNIAHEIKK